MLDAVELDGTAQAVYESLVESSPSSLDDLAVGHRLPMAQLQYVIETLESRGLINRLPGSPARYAAIAPEIALEVLILQREEELKRARWYAEQLSTRFHHAAAGRDPAELVEVITGRPAIRQRWEQLQRAAREQVRGIDKPPYTVNKPPNEAEAVETEQLARGVTYRIIYDSSGLATFHDLHRDIERSIELGERARVLTNAPCKLVIFDDRYALLPLQASPTTAQAMVVVHQSGLLEALCALFESLWAQALPFPVPVGDTPPAADQPTTDEARLLALLVTGMPDESIAKTLGLSYRTFQRRMRNLMNRLGAETRFQAGLRAAFLGWIKKG